MKTMRAVAMAAILAACSSGVGVTDATDLSSTSSTAVTSPVTAEATFPVTVTGANGEVTIENRPEAILSLSPTGTEMLFEIGAGDQVVAVDEYSYYPEEAPVTDLSGFTPNVEAIASYEPDLVLVSDDIDGVVGSLEDLGIPVLQLTGLDVQSLDDVYRQIETLGSATGRSDTAMSTVATMKERVERALASAPEPDTALTYYHELDSSHYTVTSSTFVGHVYGLFGLENIADPADADGSNFGYPQLSEEFILEADPDFIFLTDCCGDTAESVGRRPGWSDLAAVQSDAVVVFDDDVASRWGPRVVEFVEGIATALEGRDPA